jgi:protein lifeguard
MAAGMTALIVVVLTIYALTTKTDFTTCMGALWALVGVFFIFAIFALIFRHDPIVNAIYCSLGVAIFGVYLVIDVQLISQSRKYKLSEDDYIIGVLILYIDIIQIFLYLLQLLSRK